MIELIDGLTDNFYVFDNYPVSPPIGFTSVRLMMVSLGFNVPIDDFRHLIARGDYLK